jgi:hypothetical protein
MTRSSRACWREAVHPNREPGLDQPSGTAASFSATNRRQVALQAWSGDPQRASVPGLESTAIRQMGKIALSVRLRASCRSVAPWLTADTNVSCSVGPLWRMLSVVRTGFYVRGEMRQCVSPDWSALEELLGADVLCAQFMWMHDVLLDDGTVLNAYKHRLTRCYFHLADDGRAFVYITDGLYREVDRHAAIKAVFAGWERHQANAGREECAARRVTSRGDPFRIGMNSPSTPADPEGSARRTPCLR